ncbi:gamma subclass chorismate mutase AroQ [Stenotrophomonas rhizophila]|uniref:gamma subclass chorismate mutase AroQ n=1 Tax=Stenotrophomonas rhizophila TaxID=216778 RepID=UPI003518F475
MMNPARPALVIAVLCSLMLPARVAALASLDSLGVWVQRVAARNAMAHDVAAYKFVAGRPIEDPQREAAVLAETRDRAVQRGVDPDAVVHTYRQLIEANKLLQHADFQRFLLGRTPSPPPSLDAIRERIDTLDERLLSQWAQLDDVRAAPTARASWRGPSPGRALRAHRWMTLRALPWCGPRWASARTTGCQPEA